MFKSLEFQSFIFVSSFDIRISYLNPTSFRFQEFLDGLDNMFQLIDFKVLMAADVRAVVAAELRFGKVSEGVFQKLITRALGGNGIK